MIIALQKKKENIAEYLIYMWQVEDLLRACQLDESKIDLMLDARFGHLPDMTDEQNVLKLLFRRNIQRVSDKI